MAGAEPAPVQGAGLKKRERVDNGQEEEKTAEDKSKVLEDARDAGCQIQPEHTKADVPVQCHTYIIEGVSTGKDSLIGLLMKIAVVLYLLFLASFPAIWFLRHMYRKFTRKPGTKPSCEGEVRGSIAAGRTPILKVGIIKRNVPYGWAWDVRGHDFKIGFDTDGRIASIHGYTVDELRAISNCKWADDLCDAIEKSYSGKQENGIERQ